MGDARIIPFDGSGGAPRPSAARPTSPVARLPRHGEPAPGDAVSTGVGPDDGAETGDEVTVRDAGPRMLAVPESRVEEGQSLGDDTGDGGGGTGEHHDGTGDDAGARSDDVRAAGCALLGSLAQGLGGLFGGAASGVAEQLAGTDWEGRAVAGMAFLRRRITGEYEVDDFGFDTELNDQVLLGVLRPLYERYFRVEVGGLENVPAQGGALVVANHSGTLPLDALMTQVALHDHHPGRRNLRLLAADLVFRLPVVGQVARKSGHTMACHEDAERLLSRGEVVGVWPEGYKGLGKPFADRYKLQRFGRGGFVSAALRTGVPIVPCSIVGAEEIYPMIANARTVARVFGLPYFPVTPTFPLLGPLGLVPLPSRWHIRFGEPIRTDSYPPEAADDPMVVFNLTDEVRENIQHTIYRLLVQRRSVFF